MLFWQNKKNKNQGFWKLIICSAADIVGFAAERTAQEFNWIYSWGQGLTITNFKNSTIGIFSLIFNPLSPNRSIHSCYLALIKIMTQLWSFNFILQKFYKSLLDSFGYDSSSCFLLDFLIQLWKLEFYVSNIKLGSDLHKKIIIHAAAIAA